MYLFARTSAYRQLFTFFDEREKRIIEPIMIVQLRENINSLTKDI